MKLKKMLAGAGAFAILMTGGLANAQSTSNSELEARIERLEQANAELMEMLRAQQAQENVIRVAPTTVVHTDAQGQQTPVVGLSSAYSYRVLDHAENVTTKPLVHLQARQAGELPARVTLSGNVTAIANYQQSNRDSKFAYLMRHPTSNNQIGEEVSEAVIHSAALGVSANITDNVSAFVEILYNPEQSFGSGTITDLNRNQTQVRRAYVMYGNLDESPVYGLIGKMYTPFGQQNTVSPFTNSTGWHTFASLAYGAQIGYHNNGWHLRAMAIQGGSQFRAANAPVEGTNVPSRINNFAVDANYTRAFGANGQNDYMFGASYQHAGAYCLAYPVFHFSACAENNPQWAVYGNVNYNNWTFMGEFGSTIDEWPGSEVPIPANPLSQFEAVETTSLNLGAKYNLQNAWFGGHGEDAISFEFSNFVAGDDGAPWERQNQWVLGYSKFLTPNLNFFGEYIHTDGYSPLNFISGGNQPGPFGGGTWSDADARSDILLIGVQAAF